VNAVLATLIAITGLIAFQRASVYAGDGAFELAAIALDFYLLGRRTRGRRSVLVSTVVFACWLGAAAVISYSPAGGTVPEVLGVWALAGGLPFAAGRTLATRSMLTRELEATTARLQDEQKVRAASAAAEERNRIARELHDVIAHNVTVMMVQTTAARRVVRRDLGGARMALHVVQSSGRGALVELRLIVGALRREHDELAVPAVAGLAQLDALVNRARATGLSVQVHVEGHRQPLLPGLDLVAYRVLQEALTNAIKHSGSASAQVSVSFGASELELGVTDSGHGPAAERRAIRARRVVTSELERTSAQLAAEREDRARLAVAGERTRIARELHAMVAHSVAAMVVQAEAARSLLGHDPARADAAMGAIEGTGRQTLAEMRRILGVLRHASDIGERRPQPGVDQIYSLIQRERDRGQPVELSVHGEPGTLPAGVDLGIYRILEEGLQSARQQAVSVVLRFDADDLELRLTARCRGPSGWPTAAMRERVALCGGKLHPGPHDEDGWQFVARLPRGRQGALA
jgi:signal transduction histidine kinase